MVVFLPIWFRFWVILVRFVGSSHISAATCLLLAELSPPACILFWRWRLPAALSVSALFSFWLGGGTRQHRGVLRIGSAPSSPYVCSPCWTLSLLVSPWWWFAPLFAGVGRDRHAYAPARIAATHCGSVWFLVFVTRPAVWAAPRNISRPTYISTSSVGTFRTVRHCGLDVQRYALPFGSCCLVLCHLNIWIRVLRFLLTFPAADLRTRN